MARFTTRRIACSRKIKAGDKGSNTFAQNYKQCRQGREKLCHQYSKEELQAYAIAKGVTVSEKV